MKYLHTMVRVTDVEASLKFYCDGLGLEEIRRSESEKGRYTLIFLAAKTSVGDHLRERAGPWMRRLERGFADNAWSYLLILRLVPIVPFFVANVVPAFLGVRLRLYVITTLLGIIPGTAVYAAVGAGIGQVFARGEDFSLGGLMTPTILFALCGLAALSAIPIVYKKVSRKIGAR